MVFDGYNDESGMVETGDCRLATATWTLDPDFHFTNTHSLGLRRRSLGGTGRCKWGRLSGALKADRPSGVPAKRFAAEIRERNDRVVEGGRHVDDRLADVLSYLLLVQVTQN